MSGLVSVPVPVKKDGISELAFAESFVQAVYDDLNDIKHSFFRIGFRLHEAAQMGYHKKLGYANITDLAFDKFGFSKSTTYELIGIYELAHRDDAPLQIAESYDEYSQSQLRELCRLKFDSAGFMRIVAPSDTVEKIGKAVTFWNKYVFKHSITPDVDNITDLLKLDINTPAREARRYLKAKEEREEAENSASAENKRQESIRAGQLPGQIEFNLDEEKDNENSASAEKPDERQGKNSASAENSTPAAPLMTDSELIDYCLIFTSDNYFWKERKFRIQDYYLKINSQHEFVNYVKNEYGNGDACVYGEQFTKIEYGANFTIIRTRGGKVCLSWASVAGNISRLITANHYLTLKEQYEFSEWQTSQEGKQAEREEQKFSASAENRSVNELTSRRQQTRREYLQTLSDEAFATQILLQVAKVYPLGKDSAFLISRMRLRLKEWLNEPQERD